MDDDVVSNPLAYAVVSWENMRGWVHRDENEMLVHYMPLYGNNPDMIGALGKPGVPQAPDLLRTAKQQQTIFDKHPDVFRIVKQYELDPINHAKDLCAVFATHNFRTNPFSKLLDEAKSIVQWRVTWDRLTPDEQDHVVQATSGEFNILPLVQDLARNFNTVHDALTADRIPYVAATRAALVAAAVPTREAAEAIAASRGALERTRSKLLRDFTQ